MLYGTPSGFPGLLVCAEPRKRCSVARNLRRVLRHIFCCAFASGFCSHAFLMSTGTDFGGGLINNTHTHTHTHTHARTHTHSPSVFVWCESLFDGVTKRARACMYVHGKFWYQCLVSLSLPPRNQNDRWIVSECVSMSICEDTISNLSRSFSISLDLLSPHGAAYTFLPHFPPWHSPCLYCCNKIII